MHYKYNSKRLTFPKFFIVFLVLVASLSWPLTADAQDAPPVPDFDTTYLTIHYPKRTQHLFVQVARGPEQLQHGLMHRQSLEPYDGMLFVFNPRGRIVMWMKNTAIPLDMVFLSQDKEILGIHRNAKPFDETRITSPQSTYYVLEIHAGDADRYHLKKGMTLSWQ